MIKLDVEDYCQECREFGPEVEQIFADDCCCKMIITCAYAEHCKYIRSAVCRDLTEKLSKRFPLRNEEVGTNA